MIGFLDLFVPLTGRMGADAPVDFIIAILVGALGLVALPMVSHTPFASLRKEERPQAEPVRVGSSCPSATVGVLPSPPACSSSSRSRPSSRSDGSCARRGRSTTRSTRSGSSSSTWRTRPLRRPSSTCTSRASTGFPSSTWSSRRRRVSLRLSRFRNRRWRTISAWTGTSCTSLFFFLRARVFRLPNVVSFAK
jgi:hypothetical protein